MRIFLTANLLLICQLLAIADTKTVGYEYYIPDSKSETLYSKVFTPTASSEIEKDSKIKKITIKHLTDERPNGIKAIFETKEGEMPSDYKYKVEKPSTSFEQTLY